MKSSWQHFLSCYRNYFKFSGRASRSEYWFFIMWYLVFMFAPLLVVASIAPSSESLLVGICGLMLIYALISIIPLLAVTVRRFHDRNYSAWWVLGWIVASAVCSAFAEMGGIFTLLSLAVTIAYVVFVSQPGTKGDNRFGPQP